MNYIKHLNAALDRITQDDRLNPTHVSLYMTLFRFWNMNRFPDKFFISRSEIMVLAKIGSTATYHRCIKNLNDWEYIRYLPSHNPYKGSRVQMIHFGGKTNTSAGTVKSPQTSSATTSKTSSGTTTETTPKTSRETTSKRPLTPNINVSKRYINNNKLIYRPPKNKKEVLKYFEIKNWPAEEGKKFYNHYAAIGWKYGGKTKIVNWHAAAENWILKAGEFQKNKKGVPQNRDNLQTSQDKDYGEPL